MDKTDRKILTLLAEDSRRSLADIGAVAGLSASATNERIRRLAAAGALRRFTVDADPAALGLGILAFVWVELAQGADEGRFRAAMAAAPGVAECHHVTGVWSYLVKLHVADLADLEGFLAGLKARGFLARSETVIALSSAVPGTYAPKASG